MLEKLDRRDRAVLFSCLAVIAVCGAVGIRYFHRAFPEASLELKVGRSAARQIAERFLGRHGAPASVFGAESGWHFASRFDVDDKPKIYLERTLGLARANRLYGRTAPVWHWDMRWFRSQQKEEWRAEVTPLGVVIAFSHVLPEAEPGASLARESAEETASTFLAARGLPPDALSLVEVTPHQRPRRTDWTFVFERNGFRMGEATLRYRVLIGGDRVASYQEFVKIPESWERSYETLRSANNTTALVAQAFLLLTILVMVAVLVQKIVRRDVPWKLVLLFGGVAFALTFLSLANSLPTAVYGYDTSSSYPAFLVEQVFIAAFGSLAQAAVIVLLVAAGEPMFREQFPGRLSVRGVFSARGLRTRAVFRGLLLGYALVAFFFAYQTVFYIAAGKLGAWAPADVPYDDMLNTAFPWVTVLFMGFFPAVSEEFMSRIFSISFLHKYLRSKVAMIVIPALIWGFAHANYPNQPFFIRGVEVGMAGIVMGAVFLQFGIVPILVWHFTVDAVYTALLMFRSGNIYYVLSGAAASGLLLLPLAAAAVAYLRRGGFEPEQELTNGAEGFVPAPPGPGSRTLADIAPGRVARRTLAVGGVIAVLSLLTFALPADPPGSDAVDRIGRDRARDAGREFLLANGASPDGFREASYPAAGFAEAEDMEQAAPAETGLFATFSDSAADYVLGHGGKAAFDRLERNLPFALWVVRFFRPEVKEEWKLLIDARSGRVAAFAHPIDESAPAPGAPSLSAAERRASDAARRLGYPAADYAVVDAGTQQRPKRVDTRVVLESSRDAVAGARPRLSAVFHGPLLAAFWPSLKVPESFLRERASRSTFSWLLLAGKIIAGGSLLGVSLLSLVGAIRRKGVSWRSIGLPAAGFVIFGAASTVNLWPGIWRAYRTDTPLSLFHVTAAISLAIRTLGLAVLAVVALALLEAARPGWQRTLRRVGGPADALARAAVAAGGFVGLRHLEGLCATRFPAAFGVDLALPDSLGTFLPALSVLWSGAWHLLLLAGAAGAAALALRTSRAGKRPLAFGGALMLAILALPTGAHGAAQLFGPFLLTVLTLSWAIFSVAGLLRDHGAAWVAFGALALVGSAAWDLLSQAAGPDRVQGAIALVVGLAAAAAMIAGRRSAPTGTPPAQDLPSSIA
jgi:Type II CAAX prenyl endopeptidase Rce1-like